MILCLRKTGKRLDVQRYVLVQSQIPVALIFTKTHLWYCRAVKAFCVIRDGQFVLLSLMLPFMITTDPEPGCCTDAESRHFSYWVDRLTCQSCSLVMLQPFHYRWCSGGLCLLPSYSFPRNCRKWTNLRLVGFFAFFWTLTKQFT